MKGSGFLSFAKNMGKRLSNKNGQKLFDSAKKSTIDAIKTASKRAIQKTAAATGDLIGSKIDDKIKSVSKKSAKDLQKNETEEEDVRRTILRKYTYLQKKDNKLLMN